MIPVLQNHIIQIFLYIHTKTVLKQNFKKKRYCLNFNFT